MAGYDKVKTNEEACLLPGITKTKAGTDILILLVEVKKKADRGEVLETLTTEVKGVYPENMSTILYNLFQLEWTLSAIVDLF